MQLAMCAVLSASQASPLLRVAVLAGCLVVAAWCFFVGRQNVRERLAEETGRFAFLWSMLGWSKPIEGRAAVVTGWLRIVMSVVFVVYGVLFCFFPEVLAE